MRILVDIVAATSGGGLSRSRELARTLPILAPEHEYLFVADGAARDAVRDIAGAAALGPPGALRRPPLRLAWEHWQLPRTAGRTFRPDVVFSPFNVAPINWPDPKTKLAVLVSNLAPFAPEIVDAYRGTTRLRLELLRRLTNRTIGRADKVFVLSEQAYDLLAPTLDPARTELIPMAPPALPPLGPPPAYAPAEPHFLIVGDVARYKGVEMAIEALGAMPPPDRPVILVAGRTDVDRSYVSGLRERVVALGLGGRVRFLGPSGHDEILGLMRGATGVLASSRFENMSRVPFEAMALGTPILAADVPTYREACGTAALYFSLDDAEGLAALFTRVTRDAGLVDRLRELGSARLGDLDHTGASRRILAAIAALS